MISKQYQVLSPFIYSHPQKSFRSRNGRTKPFSQTKTLSFNKITEHTAKCVKAYIEYKGCKVLDWPNHLLKTSVDVGLSNKKTSVKNEDELFETLLSKCLIELMQYWNQMACQPSTNETEILKILTFLVIVFSLFLIYLSTIYVI